MATTIGTLALKFTANTSGIVAGLARAAGSVNGFSQRVQRLTSTGTGLINWFQQAASAMRETSRFADQLGASTESLIGLRTGFRLAGVGAEQVNAALTELDGMLGRAAAGNIEASRTLRLFGISAQQAAGVSTVTAFERVVNGIMSARTEADRTRLAFEAFGSRALVLLPAINRIQREGISGGDAARRLGATFSVLDATQAARSESALERIKIILEGIKQQFVIGIAPAVEAFAGWLSRAAAGAGGLGALLARWFSVALNWLTGILEALREIASAISQSVGGLGQFDFAAFFASGGATIRSGPAAGTEGEGPGLNVGAIGAIGGAFLRWIGQGTATLERMTGVVQQQVNPNLLRMTAAAVAGAQATRAQVISPLESFRQRIDEIQTQVQFGGLDAMNAQRATAAAFQELAQRADAIAPGGQARLAGAQEFGGQAATSAILRTQGRLTVQEQLVAHARSQLEQQRIQAREAYLTRLALERLGDNLGTAPA